MDLDTLLLTAVDAGASDLHLKVLQPPMARLDGALAPMAGWDALSATELDAVLQQICSHAPGRLQTFYDTGDLDLAYTARGTRFRVNAFRQRGDASFAFRMIPRRIPSFVQLGLPRGVERLADEHQGLVVVTGPTGAGKSTTLAAMLDHINRTRQSHIVTIEDPIEFLHEDRGSIVNQREVGLDTESFRRGLRQVLRQDPDVILIGELRDAESAEVALQAAESGHLVFTTLHTIDAAETIGRVIEFFPAIKQDQVRSILAGTLRGVASQRLLPRVDGGRVPAVEVMVNNARIADFIRESRTDEIPGAIADGGFWDMQSSQDALVRLVVDSVVDREVAANAAVNRHDFLIALEHALKQQRAEDEASDEQLPSIGLDTLRTAPRLGAA
jgi:twitching motility protein PilT